MLGGSLDELNVAFSTPLPGQSHLKIDIRANSVNDPFIPSGISAPFSWTPVYFQCPGCQKKGGTRLPGDNGDTSGFAHHAERLS